MVLMTKNYTHTSHTHPPDVWVYQSLFNVIIFASYFRSNIQMRNYFTSMETVAIATGLSTISQQMWRLKTVQSTIMESKLKRTTPRTDPSPHHKTRVSHQYSKGSFRLNTFWGLRSVVNFSIIFMSSLNSSYYCKIS